MDIAALEAKQLPPPYMPKVRDPHDTSNFDKYPPDAEAKNTRKYERYIDAKYEETWEREFA